MNILTILGSPRTNGNTAAVLSSVEECFRSRGHSVQRLNLEGLTISGCKECNSCKQDLTELCEVDDDGNAVLRRMLEADSIVFAAPVFCWSFPAANKALFERMYCLIRGFTPGNPDYSSKMAGKPMGLLLTSGGPIENNADLAIRGFENLVQFIRARLTGVWHVCCGPDPETAILQARSQASAFANQILTA